MKENVVLSKSFDFAVRVVRVVRLYQYLKENKQKYILSKQLVRSGTSIGANVNEAQAGQSKKDFISKMSIASTQTH
jgi:four helix bundle protein